MKREMPGFYDDHIDIQLKSDIDALLHVSATQAIEQAAGDESALVRQVRNHKKDERLINSVRCSDTFRICIAVRYKRIKKTWFVEKTASFLFTILRSNMEAGSPETSGFW